MPAKRSIKSIYIKRLVTYIDVHLTGKNQGLNSSLEILLNLSYTLQNGEIGRYR